MWSIASSKRSIPLALTRSTGPDHKSAGTNTTIAALAEGFHDYALLWTPEEYVFYVDGKEVWLTKAGGVSQVPEYLKLTKEIGKWGWDIATVQLPDYFEVDYVWVYEMSQSGRGRTPGES